jgi:hypothetical protein
VKERTQITVKLLIMHIGLGIGLVFVSLFMSKSTILLLSITQTILLILFFAGYWEFFGIRFKRLFCSVVEAAIIFSAGERIYSHSGFGHLNYVWLLFLALIQLYLLISLIRIIAVIFKRDNERLEIEFPFKNGTYLITDGGNSKISRLMNYHYHSAMHKKRSTNKSMLYATDIVKINRESTKFMPFNNEDYPIFNEKLYSPMEGAIVKVINDIENNKPFSGNYPYNTGNTVVIKNNKYYLLLGHLTKGSITVNEGDYVYCNAILGEAGNSGMSERPHLHMQLMKSDTTDYWKGLGICIQYKNKNLYKNRLIKN